MLRRQDALKAEMIWIATFGPHNSAQIFHRILFFTRKYYLFSRNREQKWVIGYGVVALAPIAFMRSTDFE